MDEAKYSASRVIGATVGCFLVVHTTGMQNDTCIPLFAHFLS